MNMDGEIRVFTESKYSELYKDLKKYNVINDFHEFFFCCVCISVKKNLEPMPLTKREERFWSKTIKQNEWATFYSIYLKLNHYDFSKLKDEKSIIKTMEEYANAGNSYIIHNFLSPYLSHPSADNYKIDPSTSKELPKHFLNHIYELSKVK